MNRELVLRLLTICHMFPCQFMPRYGVFLTRQCNYLEPHGIEFHFLVPRPWAPWPLPWLTRFREYGPDNPLLPEANQKVDSVRYFRLPGRWFRRFEGQSIRSAIEPTARRLHQAMPFDAILTSPLLPDATAARVISRKLKLPLATLSIGSDVMVYPRDNPTLENQLRLTLSQADLAVGVSQAICDRMRHYGAANPLCVYLGRDQGQFTRPEDRAALRAALGWAPDGIYGVMVGRLTPGKGTRELCAAAQELFPVLPRLHLAFVGGGPSQDEIQVLANRSEFAGRIDIAGEVPPEAIPTYLQAADFFVLPSHSEGMPQAVLEAMNCGLPIVATDVGGIPEAVTNDVNGILLEPRNSNQLTDAIRRMVRDEAFRREAGSRSYEIANDRFDAAKNADRLAQALLDLK